MRESIAPNRSPARFALAAILTALAGSSSAFAQGALGDGRGLDRNLQQGVGRVNPQGRDYAAEARFRNAIVTGNVAGGASFRGNVGYTAADDFRGVLGSNQQFGFSRDSYYSGLGGRGLRAVDALQQQMAFTIGGQVDLNAGVPILRRPGATEGITHILADEDVDSDKRRLQAVSAFTFRTGSLRSTSGFVGERAISPRVLGQVDVRGTDLAKDGPMFQVGSPLLGVSYQKRQNYERKRPEGQISSLLENDRLEGKIEGEAHANKVEPSLTPYQQILDDLRANAEKRDEAARGGAEKDRPRTAEEAAREAIERTLPKKPEADEERKQSGGDASGQGGERTKSGGADATGVPALPGSTRAKEAKDRAAIDPTTGGRRIETAAQSIMERLVQPAAPPGTDPWRDVTDSQRAALVRDARDLVRNAQPKVDHLAPRDRELNDPFTDRMRAGEAQLADGRWFDAEESFAVALQMRQGDPMAAAGRVNAQIAAGLFLSASMNLEALARTYPELIPVRFDAKLLPSTKRFEQLRVELRSAIGRDPALAKGPGLLLAYIGRQLDNSTDVSYGFAAIDRAIEQGASRDPLYDVLRAIWAAP